MINWGTTPLDIIIDFNVDENELDLSDEEEFIDFGIDYNIDYCSLLKKLIILQFMII